MLQRPSARGLRGCVAAALIASAAGAGGVTATDARSAVESQTVAGAITSVRFEGSRKSPAIVIRGRNLGKKPRALPSYSPSNQDLCSVTIVGNAGRDYGTKLYLENTTGKWAAGRYRPQPQILELDCIGLIVTRFTSAEVRYRLGAAYAQFYPRYALSNGDVVRLVVNGATATVRVRYGVTVNT